MYKYAVGILINKLAAILKDNHEEIIFNNNWGFHWSSSTH